MLYGNRWRAREHVQAVILVGGEGTRLRPLTLDTPKPMVPLFGVPFLERTLRRLRAAGVDDVILAAGYLPDAISDHFGDGSRVGVRLQYVLEAVPLGTAGALANVADRLTGRFFVLNGDVLTSLDLRAMLDFHKASGGVATLHAIAVDDPSAFGCIVHDAVGRVSSFVEKPAREAAPTNDVNAGTYLLERRLLDAIPAGRAVSIERETFPQAIAAGQPLYAFVTSDYWLDVGRPQQYLQAHADVLDGKLDLHDPPGGGAEGTMWRSRGPGMPPGVRPPAFVGHDVDIAPDAVVGPYATLGDNCSVASGALVQDSILWNGVRIGRSASVKDAILASSVVVGDGATVSRGVVAGTGAVIADGAVLEPDARIDGQAAISRSEATAR